VPSFSIKTEGTTMPTQTFIKSNQLNPSFDKPSALASIAKEQQEAALKADSGTASDICDPLLPRRVHRKTKGHHVAPPPTPACNLTPDSLTASQYNFKAMAEAQTDIAEKLS
jgi:hypothetical protein